MPDGGNDDLQIEGFWKSSYVWSTEYGSQVKDNCDCAIANKSQVMLPSTWHLCFTAWLQSFNYLTCIYLTWLRSIQLFKKIYMNHRNFFLIREKIEHKTIFTQSRKSWK